MAQNDNKTYKNITYKQMVDTFESIATNNKVIQSFNSGSLNDVDIEKLDADKFPLMYITPNPVTVDAQTITYSFDVIIAELIQEDYTGLNDAYTETLLLMKDVISNFRQATQSSSWADQRTELELPLTLEPFTSRFANMLTGWGGTFNVVCQNENDLCSVPQINNS
jgi:hypothetical protein|tara:strand:+ start:485 stop:982 length:498 start_codon:yes stop_codon:yes gene_type:complete